jgi:hypothetical protein
MRAIVLILALSASCPADGTKRPEWWYQRALREMCARGVCL